NAREHCHIMMLPGEWRAWWQNWQRRSTQQSALSIQLSEFLQDACFEANGRARLARRTRCWRPNKVNCRAKLLSGVERSDTIELKRFGSEATEINVCKNSTYSFRRHWRHRHERHR